MGCIPRVMMSDAVALVLFILLAFATHQAHGTKSTTSISNYESQQHLRNPELYNDDNIVIDLFNRWIEKHGRIYNSQSEKQHRFQIFQENMQYIHNHNVQRKSYWMGINKFSDLTRQEFLAQYLGGFQANRSHIVHSKADFIYNDVMAKPNVDWRKSGAISEIKDQGQCGSCWAFSATGAVEAVNQIATGQMITLSEQELLDCNYPSNGGCNGGYVENAFQYIYENGGICIENDYPYMTHTNFQCATKKQNSTVVSIDGYQLVPTQSENSLLKAVSMNPVSVLIEASGQDFQYYQGGIFTGSCSTNLDHAVLIVGYDTENDGSSYWIVKNSWGSWWGEAGYIRMARMGSNDPHGICGINIDPSFPIKYATK